MKNQNIIRLAALGLSLILTSGAVAAPDKSKAFERFDADGSGTVSSAELQGLWKSSLEKRAQTEGMAAAELETKMKNLPRNATNRISRQDKDGDGELSLEEFSAPMGNGQAKGPAKGNKKAGKKKDS